jgi:hypothetical protein
LELDGIKIGYNILSDLGPGWDLRTDSGSMFVGTSLARLLFILGILDSACISKYKNTNDIALFHEKESRNSGVIC